MDPEIDAISSITRDYFGTIRILLFCSTSLTTQVHDMEIGWDCTLEIGFIISNHCIVLIGAPQNLIYGVEDENEKRQTSFPSFINNIEEQLSQQLNNLL